jgi:hypothetical protein
MTRAVFSCAIRNASATETYATVVWTLTFKF